MFDVAIIGAGPAGTAAAFDLLEDGLKVLLLDKYEFPRKKACAGGITPKGYHLYRYDISSVVKRECNRIKIHPSREKPFFINNDTPLCHMTRREELDFFSLKKVMEKGVDFRVVKKIRTIDETPFFIEIQTDSECFRATYLIGADGSNSIVRRFVSKCRSCRKRFAIEADVKIDNPGKYPMEFDFSRSKNGYYWIFPKDDHVNLGIYSVDPSAKLHAKQLFEYAAARFLPNRLDAIKGYPICTDGFDYPADSKKILLAGDAAGMAEPLLGEGIYFAVKSGQLAAQSILESIQHAKSVKDLYLKKLKKIKIDLKLYNLSSKLFYRVPEISLKVLSLPFIHNRFAKGYAHGKTLTQTLCGK